VRPYHLGTTHAGIRGILKPRERRLRSQTRALDRVAPHQQLVHRVLGQTGRPITVNTLLRICNTFSVPMARLVRRLDKRPLGSMKRRLACLQSPPSAKTSSPAAGQSLVSKIPSWVCRASAHAAWRPARHPACAPGAARRFCHTSRRSNSARTESCGASLPRRKGNGLQVWPWGIQLAGPCLPC
jgi:hypothetical protein